MLVHGGRRLRRDCGGWGDAGGSGSGFHFREALFEAVDPLLEFFDQRAGAGVQRLGTDPVPAASRSSPATSKLRIIDLPSGAGWAI